MPENRKPGIYLLTDNGTEIEIVLVGLDGQEVRLPKRSPTEDLVAFVGRDFSDYKATVEALWNEHDVFAERNVVPFSDYEDFEKQAVPLAEPLRELDPVAWLDVTRQIAAARIMADDGDPIFASNKAFAVLTALRRPYFLQNRMKNIFEIAFADFERGTQQDRFRALEDIWPGMIDRSFPMRFISDSNGQSPVGTKREYQPKDLYEFYLIELSLYFQQSEKRIARCENCWRYFIPETEAQSRYCYGAVNGVPCKKSGPKFKRRLRADTDEALAVYERLRRRMEERSTRFDDAASWERENLKQFDSKQYEAWLKMAKTVKKDYQAEKISAEEFLRKIDVFGVLETYDTKKSTLPEPNRTPWRGYIRKNMDFIPESRFTDMFFLDLGRGDTAWTMITAEQQKLRARGGHESLYDRYGSQTPVDPIENGEALNMIFSERRDPDAELLTRVVRDAAYYSITGELPKESKEDDP